MFETALVTFREGLEAFLIIAITAGYLIKTDKKNLMFSLWTGIGFAVILSVILGLWLKKFSNISVFEGFMAITCAILVASLTYYVAKNAKNFSGQVRAKIDDAHSKNGIWKHLAMFTFVVLMVTRESVEVTLLLSVISYKYQLDANPMYIGAAIGVFGAGLLGFLWMKYSNLINLAKFMKVTAFFLFLFTIHLFFYGVHELAEVSVIPLINNHELAEFTEEVAEEGFFVWAITYGMIFITGWFIIQGFLNSRKL